MTCDGCRRSVEKTRLPRGWHTHAGTWCGDCWKRRFVMRAITIPVAMPVGTSWADLRPLLRDCWAEATALSNWAVRQLYAADVERSAASGAKMPKMPRVYLYGLWNEQYDRRAWWSGAANQALSVMTHAERRYLKARYEVIWRRGAALPTYRYPTPFPVARSSWSTICDSQGVSVSVALPGGRVSLALRGGAGFRRQLALLRRVDAGDLLAGECALYERRIEGGQKSRLMFKAAVWVPVAEGTRDGERAMTIRTTKGALLSATVAGREDPWTINADRIFERIAAHACYRLRMSEDLKYEKRWPARMRKQMAEDLARRCTKHNSRVDAFVHEVSAMAIAFAARQAVTRIDYDDTERRSVSFPWYALKQRLRDKSAQRGIEFIASDEVTQDSPLPLASGDGE